jgi:hypothetical protein
MQKEPKPSRNDNILHYHENFIYQEQNIDFVYNEQLYYQNFSPLETKLKEVCSFKERNFHLKISLTLKFACTFKIKSKSK